MTEQTAYKIFDLHTAADGRQVPKTLFHGLNGSRKLPLGKWLEAEKKDVTDGSRQEPYVSGFHAYPDMEAVRSWLRGAKQLAHRVVVEVRIRGLRRKPRAVRDTILADWMKITPRAWANRIPAVELAEGVVTRVA